MRHYVFVLDYEILYGMIHHKWRNRTDFVDFLKTSKSDLRQNGSTVTIVRLNSGSCYRPGYQQALLQIALLQCKRRWKQLKSARTLTIVSRSLQLMILVVFFPASSVVLKATRSSQELCPKNGENTRRLSTLQSGSNSCRFLLGSFEDDRSNVDDCVYLQLRFEWACHPIHITWDSWGSCGTSRRLLALYWELGMFKRYWCKIEHLEEPWAKIITVQPTRPPPPKL